MTQETSPDGNPKDRSPENFYKMFAQYEKYFYFETKWNVIDNSTPYDMLDRVAMRVDDAEEYQFAHNIFKGLPKKSRLAYAFHYGGGLSYEEIAQMHLTKPEKIERAVAKIHSLLASQETREVIIRFAKTELQFFAETSKDVTVAMMREMGLNPQIAYGTQAAVHSVNQSAIPAVIDSVSQTVASVAETVVNVTETMGANFDAITATAAAGTAATVKLLGSKAFVTGFSKIAFLLIWVLMIVASGMIWGKAIIENAQTLFARRWLVKQLFIVYCGFLALPLYFLMLGIVLSRFVSPQNYQNVTGVISTIVAILLFVYLGRSYLEYLVFAQSEEHADLSEYASIERLIHLGMKPLTIYLWGLFTFMTVAFFISDGMVYLKTNRYLESVLVLCIPITCGAVMGYVHRGMFQSFKYFLYLSREKETIRRDPKLMMPILEAWLKKINQGFQKEFGIILRFAVFPIGANLIHLAIYGNHLTGSLLEIAGFGVWWFLVFFQNVRQPEYRKYFLYGSLLAQIVVMFWLRVTIYG